MKNKSNIEGLEPLLITVKKDRNIERVLGEDRFSISILGENKEGTVRPYRADSIKPEHVEDCITTFLVAKGYTRWDNISINKESDTPIFYNFDKFKNTDLPILPFNLLFHHINGSDEYVFSTHDLNFDYKRGWALIYDMDTRDLRQYNSDLIFPAPHFSLTFHHKRRRKFDFIQPPFEVEMDLTEKNDEFLQRYKYYGERATLLYRILQSLFQQDFKNDKRVEDLSYTLSHFLQAKYSGTKGSPYDSKTKKLDLPSYVQRLRQLKEPRKN